MAVQTSQANSTNPLVLFGNPAYSKQDSVFLTDAGRATPLLFGTVVAKIAATGKLIPMEVLTLTTGGSIPYGVYIGSDIPAADLVAGDVVDAPVLIGAAAVDENQLVVEGATTLDSVVGALASVVTATVRDFLAMRGIFAEDTINISSQEN